MRRRTPNDLLGRSAISSYRADLPLGGAPPSEVDGETIIVATLLRHAVSAAETVKAKTRLVREATRLAKISLGKEALARGCAYDPPGQKSDLDVLRLIAERTEQRGSLEMAANFFEALAALAEPGSLTAGRIVAERARNARKRGYLDLSYAQLQHLRSYARHLRSAELEVRAQLGLGALAQSSGNLPAMRRHALKAVRLGEQHGYKRLQSIALNGLATQTALAGEFVRAAGYAWRGFVACAGDVRAEHEFLLALGQILLDAGHAPSARDTFVLLLNREPRLRLALPAFGGFVLALAEVGDVGEVHRTVRRVTTLAKTRGHQREVASALVDCGRALNAIGERDRAATILRRASRLASHSGFHDLVHLAEQQLTPAASRPEPARLTGDALVAAKWVTISAPAGLRSDLTFAGADL